MPQAMSYAEVAASGPSQSPKEAAAPQMPQVIPAETADVTPLVDVDTPSVRTVPSDFREQSVKTETQEKRKEREEREERGHARARADADFAKKKKKSGAVKARKADNVLTNFFANLSDRATTAIVVTNVTAVAGVSTYLGYKGMGLYERGALTWKKIGMGTGIVLTLGIIEAVLGNYLYKGDKEEESENS